MSKSVNVRYLLQRVIAAALILLALWIFYSKLVGDEYNDADSENDSFRNPSIANTTPKLVSIFKKLHKYLLFATIKMMRSLDERFTFLRSRD